MRFIVYAVAVLAAASIVYLVGDNGSPQSAEADPLTVVQLRVPKMHCPIACYPAVKKTLESQQGVRGVELAEQQQEETIDNPVVLIETDAGFDPESAIAALADTGFENSTVIR